MDELDWKILAELHATPNVTRTAGRLNMTQSALSKRLRQIESEMEIRVVLRCPRGVAFTAEGDYLARRAGELLDDFSEIRRTLLELGSGWSGVIRIGATNGFARSILPPYLRQYRELHPGVEFDITADVSATLGEAVRERRLHVGFVCGEGVAQAERFLVCSDQALAVSRTPFTLEDLPNLPRIVYQKDPFSTRLLDQWWHDRFTVPPRIGMHANHGDTCREMVLAGLGYAIFLSRAFLSEHSGLVERPLTYANGTPLLRHSWMIWQPDFFAVPLVRHFIEFMQASLERDRAGLSTTPEDVPWEAKPTSASGRSRC